MSDLQPHAVVMTEATERHYVIYAENIQDALARQGEWIETAARPVLNIAAMPISASQYDAAIEQFVNGVE
jgi:hypothetical protein